MRKQNATPHSQPMSLSEKLDSIELKVREVAFKLERLKKENAALREENKTLKAMVDRLQQVRANAESDPIDIDQASPRQEGSTSPAEGEESEKLRAQIDQYIREIDQCIEWLNNN